MTEEREPETEKAIVPTWSDMETGEKIATATAWTLIIGGILAGPHILCSLAGRPLPSSISGFFFDAVVVELLGMVLLVFLPLKAALKRWLYGKPGEEPRAPTLWRWAVAILWVTVMLGMTALLIPQGFFALTGRETASTLAGWGRDSLAALAALLPQIIAMVPYIWAMRRAWNRLMDQHAAPESTEEDAMPA